MKSGDRRGSLPRRPARSRAELQAQVEATRSEISAQVRATRAQLEQANERINARSGRNLLFATIFGLILGLSMLFSLVLVKELFMIVAAVLIGFAVFELAGALRFAGRDVPRIPSVAAGVLVVPAAYYGLAAGQWLGMLGGVLLVTLWRLVELAFPAHRAPRDQVLKDLGAGLLIQLYVVFLGSCAVALTAQPGGQWWTVAFILLVVSVDTGAYAFGLNFGKHPMAPRISPKKTWEGFAGSVLVALVVGILLSVFMLGQSIAFGVLFAVTITLSATIGDLTESMIKRDLGIKDISSWLPGHGGLLDRLDSILPSAAAGYALYLLVH